MKISVILSIAISYIIISNPIFLIWNSKTLRSGLPGREEPS